MRAIDLRQFQNCGKGNGPRSVSSNSRIFSSLRFLSALCCPEPSRRASLRYQFLRFFPAPNSSCRSSPFPSDDSLRLSFPPTTVSRISIKPAPLQPIEARSIQAQFCRRIQATKALSYSSFARNADSAAVSPCDNSPPLKLCAAARPASVKTICRWFRTPSPAATSRETLHRPAPGNTPLSNAPARSISV